MRDSSWHDQLGGMTGWGFLRLLRRDLILVLRQGGDAVGPGTDRKSVV